MISVILSLLTVLAGLSYAGPPYCLPSDDCFPSADKLQRFNSSVDGRLIKVVPYGAACYKSFYNAEACAELAKKKHDFDWRARLPAGLMYTNWEQDGKSGCPVPDPSVNAAPPPVMEDCTLGGMSAYVVNATCEDHIIKAVNFAAQYNLRLRIKNTGHDYTGRSSGAGSFAIWTHYMNDVKLSKDFRPCYSSKPQDAISMGPGVSVGELYDFTSTHGVVTTGGYTNTVGAGGGFILGGGTGPFGSQLGMAVDNVLQFEVVTADGTKKTVNECQNPDLFWALRGGGGAFGVTTRVYFKTSPAPKAINTVVGRIECGDPKTYKDLINRIINIQVSLRNEGHVGLWAANSGKRFLPMVCVRPFFNNEAIQHPNDTFKELQSIFNTPGCRPQVRTAQSVGETSWADAYRNTILPTIQPNGPVGVNIADNSRLISYDQMNNRQKLNSIKNYIVNLPPEATFIWQNSVGEASRRVSPNATAVHPDWRNAFAFMDVYVLGPWPGVSDAQTAIAQAALDNATDVFGNTAFYNEAWILDEDWQKAFWGTNYDRLLKIKNEVDPKRLFNCRRCVGSEDAIYQRSE